MVMLLAAACAKGPIRGQIPAARGAAGALSVAMPKSIAPRMPLMRVARAGATATPLKTGPNAGKILIVGGSGRVVDLGTKEIEPLLASTELYDPLSNTFAAGPNMHVAREEHTATMIVAGPSAGKILIAGGEGDAGFLASTELYDPASNRFIAGPKVSTVGIDHSATAIASGPNAGKILLAGGYDPYEEVNSTELYDPASNTLAPGPSMSGERMADTATVIPAGPNAGKILIAGGDGSSFAGGKFHSGILASTELYDPASNTFAPGPFMNVARESATATAIASGPNAGEILIAGGFGESRKPLSSTEIYDPKTNRFTPGPAMNVGRQEHTATVIAAGPNAGKILIAGGLGADSYLASTELYDPATNTFAVGPSMNVARYEDTATVIPSGPNAGMIMLAGGASYVGVLASAELYDPVANKFAPPPKTAEMEIELPPAAAFR